MASRPREKLNKAPISEVLLMLLSHLRAALADAGLALSGDANRELAAALASGDPHPSREALTTTLTALVDDSLKALQAGWNLDFAAALGADASALGAWETTAEYLELANKKAELETRIVTASALLVAAGRGEYAQHLQDVIAQDAGAMDVDAIVAGRILQHIDAAGPASPSKA